MFELGNIRKRHGCLFYKMKPRKFHSSYKQDNVMHRVCYIHIRSVRRVSLMHTFGYVYYTCVGIRL